jgi:hypothetical protein
MCNHCSFANHDVTNCYYLFPEKEPQHGDQGA